MKRRVLILTILAAMAVTTGARAQVNLVKHPRVKSFLSLMFTFSDVNPIHQPEADSIAALFGDILAAWDGDPHPWRTSVDDGLKRRALDLFYDNSHTGDEDSFDVYRMAARRYRCCLALALLPGTDYGWYTTFIEDARECVRREYRDDRNPEVAFAIIDLVELLLDINHSEVSKYTVEKMGEDTAALSKWEPGKFTEWFIEEYTAIKNLIDETFKEPGQSKWRAN